VEVNFNALDDEAERTYFKRLPTSFVLKPEEVDNLRDAARPHPHQIQGVPKAYERSPVTPDPLGACLKVTLSF